MIPRRLTIFVLAALGLGLLVPPGSMLARANARGRITNISVSVTAGSATYAMCVRAPTRPSVGAVTITGPKGDLQAPFLYNDQTCGFGTYFLLATLPPLPTGVYRFKSACVLLDPDPSGQAGAIIPCLVRPVGLVSNFEGATIASSCQVDFNTSHPVAARNCLGPGVEGNVAAPTAMGLTQAVPTMTPSPVSSRGTPTPPPGKPTAGTAGAAGSPPLAISALAHAIGPGGGALGVRVAQRVSTHPGAPAVVQTFTVLVPAGSVTQATIVAASVAIPIWDPSSMSTRINAPLGAALTLSASTATGKASGRLARPLIVQSSYAPAALGDLDPTTLVIAQYDVKHHTWQALPTTVDRGAHLLIASVPQLSTLQVRATARTVVQLQGALARAAMGIVWVRPLSLAPSSTGDVSLLRLASLPGGVPVVASLPQGVVLARSAAAVHVLGAPHARLVVTYRWAHTQVVRYAVLDSRGYTAVAAPPLAGSTARHNAQAEITLSLFGVTAHATSSFILSR